MATGWPAWPPILNRDPNDPNDPMAAGQMTWCMLAPADNMRALAMVRRPARRWPAWPTTCGWVARVGPAAKGHQKRTGREQFF
jgi:hypothetical protein